MQPILLRPWRDTDAEALRSIFNSATDLEHQFPYPVTTLAEAQQVIMDAMTCHERRIQLAITVEDQPVGNVAISNIDRIHDTGWVSYFSAASVRGQGLVKRAAAAMCNWALAAAPHDQHDVDHGLGLFRLELGHRVNNPASGAVALAAGFVREGRERQRLRYGNERFDVDTYGRLASDPAPAVAGVTMQLPS